jgi:hypothetical protein
MCNNMEERHLEKFIHLVYNLISNKNDNRVEENNGINYTVKDILNARA